MAYEGVSPQDFFATLYSIAKKLDEIDPCCRHGACTGGRPCHLCIMEDAGLILPSAGNGYHSTPP